MVHANMPVAVAVACCYTVQRGEHRKRRRNMSTWTFQPAAKDAPKLHAVTYSSSEPKAVLFFHHGITEHSARYHNMFTFLSGQGITCHSYDARAHGQSELDVDERLKIDSFDSLVTDLIDLCTQKRVESPELPCFIGGQSMGALVAAYAARTHQDWFNGLIMTSPCLDVDKNITLKIQSLFGAPMQAIAPWARLVPAVKVEDMSESEEVRQAIVSDPLICHTNIPIKTARQVEGAMNSLKPAYKDFTLPIYGLHGDSDRCTSMRGHKAFIENASSTDKTFDVIPGGYHEPLMGPQKQECFVKISTWILARTSPAPQIKTPL